MGFKDCLCFFYCHFLTLNKLSYFSAVDFNCLTSFSSYMTLKFVSDKYLKHLAFHNARSLLAFFCPGIKYPFLDMKQWKKNN